MLNSFLGISSLFDSIIVERKLKFNNIVAKCGSE